MATTAKDAKTAEIDLFPDVTDVAAGTQLPTEHVALSRIEPDPDNPRTDADDDLVSLIRKHGVKPLTVTPAPDADKRKDGVDLRILDGERRYWGAIKVGLTTVPVIIDRTPYTPIQRIVRQAALNASKQLSPMDEARMFKRVQDETGWSEEKIGEIFQRKKSTVADRLALVNAPEAFQALFLSGLLSASAAPIVRKFFSVPENILEMAARTAPADLSWEAAKRAGKPVELKDVGRVLDKIILGERMRELPEHLVLLYQGPRCKVASVEYAVDIPQFIEAQRKYETEKRRAEIEKAKPLAEAGAKKPLGERSFHERDAIKTVGGLGALGGEEDEEESLTRAAAGSVAPTAKSSSKTTPNAAERKRQQQMDQERTAEQRKRDAWQHAKPELLRSIAAAIKIVPVDSKGPIAEYLLENICNSRGVDLPEIVKLLPRGTTPADFMRFMVMILLHTDVVEDYNVEGFPRALRELGLKVDVPKILDNALKQQHAKASGADRSAGTPKRGGRPLTSPAPTKTKKGASAKQPARTKQRSGTGAPAKKGKKRR